MDRWTFVVNGTEFKFVSTCFFAEIFTIEFTEF